MTAAAQQWAAEPEPNKEPLWELETNPFHTADAVEALEGAPASPNGAAGASPSGPAESAPARKPGPPSQATQLVDLASDVELFRTPAGEAYVSIRYEEHRETWPLRSGQFRSFLARRYYLAKRGSPGGQAVQDALGVLEGQALFEGTEISVAVRVADHDGAVYLDLADERWRAVRVAPDGWEIVDEPPVRFRRPRGMLPLPAPERWGSVDELLEFVNVTADEFPLLVSWLVAALRPRGPYPVLHLGGEQGSAKSTCARIVRELIDPNEVPLRAQPKDERDLQIAARNAWMLVFDNLSGVPAWLSDALCRLSTGGGLATRELYTDADEILFQATRPVLLTGIDNLAARGDLIDRSIVLTLPPLGDDRYRSEDELWPAFEDERPSFLGVLLDAVASALGRLPDVHPQQLPRMADFVRWVTAAEPALDWEPGTFAHAYSGNRADAREAALDGSSVAEPIRRLASDGFLGIAADLLARIGALVTDDTRRRRDWPANPRALSSALRRLAPTLRAVGVEISFGHRIGDSTRGIRIAEAADANASGPDANRTQNAEGRTQGTPAPPQQPDAPDAKDANRPFSEQFLWSNSEKAETEACCGE